jgi:hypothetical protein
LPSLVEGEEGHPPPRFGPNGEWLPSLGGDPNDRWSYLKTGPDSCVLQRPLGESSSLVGTLHDGRWTWAYDPGNGEAAYPLGELTRRR